VQGIWAESAKRGIITQKRSEKRNNGREKQKISSGMKVGVCFKSVKELVGSPDAVGGA
jgi:hypothetical protein